MNILILALASLSAVTLLAQQPAGQSGQGECSRNEAVEAQTDTAKIHRLDEFVVEGRSQLVGKTGISFIPSKKEVKHSHNACTLIQNMGIPFLQSDGWTISSKFSGEVMVFIDYLQASEDDLQSLQPKDVLKIEYLEYPVDSRFKGARYVVNFIMRKIEYGGYVKGNGLYVFMNNDGYLSFYSKYAYRKLMLDFNASYSYKRNSIKSKQDEQYMGFDKIDPAAYPEIKRINESKRKLRNNIYSINGRVKYSSGKTVMANTLRLSYSKTPESRNKSTLCYSPQIFDGNYSESLTKLEYVSPSWTGDFNFQLNPQMGLNVEGYFQYINQHRNRWYDAEGIPSIENFFHYKAYSGYAMASWSYSINARNELTSTFLGQWTQTDTQNSGTDVQNPDQRGNFGAYSLSVAYTHTFPNNMRFSLSGRGVCSVRDLDGRQLTEWYPTGYVNLYCPINSKNSLTFSGSYSQYRPGVTQYSDALTQTNEILWVQGNPDYKLNKNMTFNAGYTYSPSNAVSIAGYAYLAKDYNMATAVWNPVDLYKVIQTWDYNGRQTIMLLGVSATLKLFDGNLRVSPDLGYTVNRYSKVQHETYERFNYKLSASYYFGDFSFNARYRSKSVSMVSGTGGYANMPSMYGFDFGYDKNNLSINFGLSNIFSKGRYSQRVVKTSDYYSDDRFFDTNYMRSISLSVVYTFDFGKKVNKWDTI